MHDPHLPIRPVLAMALRPVNADLQALQRALEGIGEEDPTLRVEATGPHEITILGMGELHLLIIRDRLSREHHIDTEADDPTVLYLETIRKTGEAEGKFIRHTGGHVQYGHVKLRLEPNSGNGYKFVSQVGDDAVPRKYLEPIDEGIREAMKSGIVAGFPMIDIKATLFDGSHQEGDAHVMAFKIAGAMAFKEAARRAAPVLLEPLMSVEVSVPEEFMGTVIGDLNSRRGHIEGMEHRAGSQVIKAIVPLAEMFGYAAHVRSTTQGRATYAMHFARYAEAPPGRGEAEGPGVLATPPHAPIPKVSSMAAQSPLESDDEKA